MKRPTLPNPGSISVTCLFLLAILGTRRSSAEPGPAALIAFNTYAARVEARLGEQHRGRARFVADVGPEQPIHGEPVLQRMTLARDEDVPGGLLQSWRGTAFVPGAHASDFERLLRDFKSYPRYFAPEVLRGDSVSLSEDRVRAMLRVRQKHVLTVVMDASYDVQFGRLDSADGFSTSRSTTIEEVVEAGTAHEHALNSVDDHGFLWRLNTYWTWQERDGGLYVQIETVSLSRAIPTGLGWALKPYVESVPRESLEFTLRSACAAVLGGKR